MDIGGYIMSCPNEDLDDIPQAGKRFRRGHLLRLRHRQVWPKVVLGDENHLEEVEGTNV